METVHVLCRVYAFYDGGGVELRRQGELHQNPVYMRLCIQAIDQIIEFLRVRIRRQLVGRSFNSDLTACIALVAHIDFGSRVRTYQHHGEARAPRPFGRQTKAFHFRAQPAADVESQGFAVQKAGWHRKFAAGRALL
jgi:hypothetical protein